MRGGDDVGTGGVNPGVDRESCSIDWIFPFHDFAAVIHQDEVRNANLAEVHSKGI